MAFAPKPPAERGLLFFRLTGLQLQKAEEEKHAAALEEIDLFLVFEMDFHQAQLGLRRSVSQGAVVRTRGSRIPNQTHANAVLIIFNLPFHCVVIGK